MITNKQKMKTKKRTINSESSICKNKINTRKMHNKTLNESNLSSFSAGNNANSTTRNKPSPNTRAKSNCVMKSHSDPYAFSKIDDEDKIPLKRIKVTEKLGKEVGVNTSNLSTMTEPEYLGPCEPGTSIELQGIVWLETASGLLVINVTWRGRTYVGTLMDSTKYEFTPSFSQENSGKFESRPSNRSTRGKKRQVGNPGNHFTLRSHNIRHSRRLNESLNFSNSDGMIKKLTTRQNNNLINYFDSTNQSATASASGDSDTDKNSYSKFSTNSKTRSVTRSITKLNKAALCDYNSNSIEDNERNLIPCSRENCFKRFIDMTAYKYHVQRCHDSSVKDEDFSFHDTNSTENNFFENNEKVNFIKEEPTNKEKELMSNNNVSHNYDNLALKNTNSKLNGVINKEGNTKINEFEFHSDSEIDKNTHLSINSNENKYEMKSTDVEKSDQTKDIKSIIKLENTTSQFQELSINLPKVSENLLVNSDISLPNPYSSTRETSSLNCDDKGITSSFDSVVLSNKLTSATMRTSICDLSSITTVISHSSSNIRTVTAPTVSIPVELINTSNNFTNSTITCPTLIRPKPNQNPITSLIHSSQNRKFKSSSKSMSQSNGVIESFQIPSSTPVIIKKRPLVPLKVSVNQTTTNNNVNRVYPISSHLNVTSPNQSSRHIRSSSISPVTPILPATSAVISSTLSLTNTTSITGQSINASVNNIYHNGQLSVRRPSMTTNLTQSSGLSTLVSLKPIQPKPKSSQASSLVSTSHLGINTSPYAPSQSIIVPSISGISNIHVSHQRQILPSPVSKSDCGTTNADESLIHKIESLKNSSLKRKRRKPEKKMRHNFHESNRYKKFSLNPIQPKYLSNDHYPGKLNSDEFGISSEKYKTDEENSHSPGYSDLSETNDTPAPILEKEIDLKTGDCDKLIISTDFDRMPSYLQNISSSDNYDDPKDLSNKPPALMPAVLSSDLVNGSTNELDYREIKPRVSRKKSINNKKTHKIKEVTKGKVNSDKLAVSIDWISITTTKSNIAPTSNRKSFQSLSPGVQQSHTSASFVTSQSPITSLSSNQEFPAIESNTKISSNRNSVPSTISECIRSNKISSDKNIINNRQDSTFQLNHVLNDDNGKIRNKSAASPNNTSGKFSVQALTSPQELVSRSLSFATSSTVPSIIPNIKISNSILKN